ncbi:MAG: ABC transporter permease [Planctomycetota bacterium]
MSRLPFEYAVRNQTRAPGRTLLQFSGSVLVPLLVLASAAFVVGLERSLAISASPANVILLSTGSEESIERSQIDARVASIAAASIPGIRRRLGEAAVSPEVHLGLSVRTGSPGGQDGLAVVRGVTSAAFLVHDRVRIFEGRVPESGANEVMVGRLLGAKLGSGERAVEVGSTLWIDEQAWQVVGRFEAPGTVLEGEIWAPLTDLQVLARRDSLSCVVLSLENPSDFARVEAFAISRLDLEITAMTEIEYYRKLGEFFAPIRWLVVLTAILIGAGGVLGGLNLSYAAFAARIRELGTLQVLGFSRTAILLTLVQESALVAAAGSLVAAGLGLVFLDGIAIRFSMGIFGLVVNGPVVAVTLSAGLALGVLGTIPPSLRCLTAPLTTTLKS